MTFIGWSQIAIVLALTLIAAIPLSGLIAKIYAGEANVLTPVLQPVERVFYRLAGVRAVGEEAADEVPRGGARGDGEFELSKRNSARMSERRFWP